MTQNKHKKLHVSSPFWPPAWQRSRSHSYSSAAYTRPDGWLLAGILSWYVTSQSGQLSLLPSVVLEMNTGQRQYSLAAKVTAGLAFHWSRVTDSIVYSSPMG